MEEGYHLQDTIVVIGEGFVLKACQHWRSNWAWRRQTIVHTPLRSWSVRSGGAAIVDVLESVVWVLCMKKSEKKVFVRGIDVLMDGYDSAFGIEAHWGTVNCCNPTPRHGPD